MFQEGVAESVNNFEGENLAANQSELWCEKDRFTIVDL
jgi:hypothetical protein